MDSTISCGLRGLNSSESVPFDCFGSRVVAFKLYEKMCHVDWLPNQYSMGVLESEEMFNAMW